MLDFTDVIDYHRLYRLRGRWRAWFTFLQITQAAVGVDGDRNGDNLRVGLNLFRSRLQLTQDVVYRLSGVFPCQWPHCLDLGNEVVVIGLCHCCCVFRWLIIDYSDGWGVD